MSKHQTFVVCIGTFVVVVALILSPACKAQDYDDEAYGNQGDTDTYNGASGGGYGANDDNYSGNNNNNMPNYQQNVDSEGSNNQPSSYQAQNGNADSDGDYDGDDSAAASSLSRTVVRVRRQIGELGQSSDSKLAAASEPKLRVKRHGKYYIGPVYTYVKTDKHANFKWGVKHKVGKKQYG